jgi:hypothetical protein
VRQDALEHQLLLEAHGAGGLREEDLGQAAHGELADQLVLAHLHGGLTPPG